MGFLNRKIKKLQESEQFENLGKVTSEKAVDVIRQLGGTEASSMKSAMIDNYVLFTSAGSGAGASTIVSNVAYMAATKGLKVIVIDLNIVYPIQHTFLGIKQEATEQNDLVKYLNGKCTLGEAIDSSHIYSIMYANNRNLYDLITCNSDIAITNYNDMISKIRKLFDLIIIDCPLILENEIYNNAFYGCDSIYMVWDEGLGSLTNTDRARRNMSYCGIDSYTKLRVILNKRTYMHYSTYPLKKLNLEMVGILPFDVSIIENSSKAQIFCEKGASNSPNAAEFERNIAKITDKILKIGGLIE